MTIKVLSDSDNTFSRLFLWYFIALSTIATIIITGQILIQNFLNDQNSDARVINVSGRQRMLSQRIAKLALMAKLEPLPSTNQQLKSELTLTIEQWERAQFGLIEGNDSLELPGNNSKIIRAKFEENMRFFEPMLQSARQINELLASSDSTSVQENLLIILDNEQAFLASMNEIVYLYEQEAQAKLQTLRWAELALLAISLLVIVLEILFIFRPTANQVNKTLKRLVRSEKQAQKMAAEIGALYQSLEKSYEEISSVSLPENSPRLIARTDKGGNLTFVTKKYLEQAELTEEVIDGTIQQLFPGSDLSEDFMDDVVEFVSDEKSYRDAVQIETASGKQYSFNLIITPIFNSMEEINGMVVMAADTTERKQAEKTMNEKNRADIERKINEQKYRSVLVLEGQEEERKRLAMDLHDGIGQMLTSLKFHVESIDLGNVHDSRLKLSEINRQMKDLIKEVRRVTFNLKPMVLGDYGLIAGLAEYAKEMNKLSDVEITFVNESDQKERLPMKVENNIYRILQEAVNNAIKYAESDVIELKVKRKDDNLVFKVQDYGKGIEPEKLKVNKPGVDSGHGFFNMYERSEYLNGKLSIQSEPGEGTQIKLEVPLND